MQLNWFMLMSGALWLGATVQAYCENNMRMVVVGVCYALATFALMGAK